MLLEKINAAKKAFALKFQDTDVVEISFHADKSGYNEMHMSVRKQEEAGSEYYSDVFGIRYSWDGRKEDSPAFVMDMMALLHQMGKINAENGDIPEDAPEEVVEVMSGEEEEEEVEVELDIDLEDE
jgi:hypothetical protein